MQHYEGRRKVKESDTKKFTHLKEFFYKSGIRTPKKPLPHGRSGTFCGIGIVCDGVFCYAFVEIYHIRLALQEARGCALATGYTCDNIRF